MDGMHASTTHRETTGRVRAGDRARWGVWSQLAGALAIAVVALAALVRVALHSEAGMDLDERLMMSLGGSARAWMRIIEALTTITVWSGGLCLAICLVVGLSRRRWAVSIAAVALVAGANVTTQVLKHEVFHRLPGAGVNSLPSGHTTASLSLVLAALLVAPSTWRKVVMPLAGFIGTFVAAGTIAGHWHRPADVIAGQAVCLGWAALVLAFVVLVQRREPLTRGRGIHHLWLALLGSAVVGLVFVAWGVRPTAGDVDLPLVVAALVPVGVITALVVGWVASFADRHLA